MRGRGGVLDEGGPSAEGHGVADLLDPAVGLAFEEPRQEDEDADDRDDGAGRVSDEGAQGHARQGGGRGPEGGFRVVAGLPVRAR